eukprot:s373_g8.t1
MAKPLFCRQITSSRSSKTPQLTCHSTPASQLQRSCVEAGLIRSKLGTSSANIGSDVHSSGEDTVRVLRVDAGCIISGPTSEKPTSLYISVLVLMS